MKKILAVILTLSIFFPQVAQARLSASTGSTMYDLDAAAWLYEYSAEGKVSRILSNNYAFIAGENRYWSKNSVQSLTNTPYIAENTLYIPGDYARSEFAINDESEYISVETIAENTSYDVFYDPRGFALLSENIEDSVITDYNTNTQAYFDYYTVWQAIGTILWDDISPSSNDYLEYRNNWTNALTSPENTSESYSQYLSSLQRQTSEYIAKINTENSDSIGPFIDLTLSKSEPQKQGLSAEFEKAYERVLVMAKYYSMSGKTDTELKETILNCLSVLKDFYTVKIEYDFRDGAAWVNYAISIPYIYSNILCLMYDDMSSDLIKAHTNAIFDRAPEPTLMRGSYDAAYNLTNLSWSSIAYLNTAIIAQDAERVNYALRYMLSCFMYNAEGYNGDLTLPLDGIYRDGSLKFHNGTAYNMGYGVQNIYNIAELLVISRDTIFDVRNVPYYDNIYEQIEKTFLPFFVENIKVKAVTGRWATSNSYPQLVMLATVVNGCPDELTRTRLSQIINESIKSYENKNKTLNVTDGKIVSLPAVNCEIEEFKNYCIENGINNDISKESEVNVYYNMDRAVYNNDDTTAVVSMNSSRTNKYEGLGNADNGGNDWYVNDGALYIYTGDYKQFNSEWFNTADRYRIPGTTVDSTQRSSTLNTMESAEWGMPQNDWAGGATDGQNAALGMILDNTYVSGLEAKKSYFIVGDKIICIGTDISGGEGDVYTTIDQRIVK